jgi:hypothetical protein
VEDDVADALADRRAAGLAYRDDQMAISGEPFGEALGLDRLAGCLPTLEREEEAAHL